MPDNDMKKIMEKYLKDLEKMPHNGTVCPTTGRPY